MSGTIKHSWNGTVLTITSDSGTSSCDLKGAKGDTGIRGAQGVAGAGLLDTTMTKAGYAAEATAVKDYVAANAAPIGYGLGETSKDCADCNLATVNGFYRLTGTSCVNYPDRVSNFKYGAMLALTRRTNAEQSTVYQIAAYDGLYAMRHNSNGNIDEWYDWGYLNPQFNSGAEYKTMERYKGKVVYTKLISFGALPASGSKSVALASVSTSSGIISIEGIAIKEGGSAIPFPMIDISNGAVIASALVTNAGNLAVYVYKDLSAYTANFIVKYTKD